MNSCESFLIGCFDRILENVMGPIEQTLMLNTKKAQRAPFLMNEIALN